MKTFQKIVVIIILQIVCCQYYINAQDTISVNQPGKQKPDSISADTSGKHKSDTISISRRDKHKTDTVSSSRLFKHKSDTTSDNNPPKHKFIAEPLKASMMAVAFPGLGQIYNRKYWKVPVVYAGFGGLIYSVGSSSTNYNKYMRAFQDFTDNIEQTDSYVALISADPSTYDRVKHPDSYSIKSESFYKDGMLRAIDYYRRNRDLSYIGIGVWYLVSILDANVDASLFDFDISNNLDIAVFPVQLSLPGGFVGAGLNMNLTITF